jgi:hypothetical protein
MVRRRAKLRYRDGYFGDIGREPIRIACMETALSMLEEALR